jgi:hypothetical protein
MPRQYTVNTRKQYNTVQFAAMRKFTVYSLFSISAIENRKEIHILRNLGFKSGYRKKRLATLPSPARMSQTFFHK